MGSSPTESTRRRYDRSAGYYDLLYRPGERLLLRGLRERLWAEAPTGRVLEVGVGTGANMEFYPRGARVVAIDLSPGMMAKARDRLPADDSTVTLQVADVQSLDMPDDSFDAAVASLVFCSVPDPVAGLRELRRVVRPGGRVLLLDHVRVDLPVIGTLMDLLDPLAVRLTGAHINRRTSDNVRRSGLIVESEERHGPFGLLRLIAARVPEPSSPPA